MIPAASYCKVSGSGLRHSSVMNWEKGKTELLVKSKPMIVDFLHYNTFYEIAEVYRAPITWMALVMKPTIFPAVATSSTIFFIDSASTLSAET